MRKSAAPASSINGTARSITFSYNLPYNITAGTVAQLASSRPFNATTGIDNNGDGANNDRPVVDGKVISKSAFQGTPTSEVGAVRARAGSSIRAGRSLLRVEVFNLFNHGNILGRAQTTYGDTSTIESDIRSGRQRWHVRRNALPSLANIDPPRMVQFQVRYQF